MTVEIRRAPREFCDWGLLLELLHAAFAYQSGRIDPPSSVHGLDAEALAGKAKDEHLFLAVEDGEVVGCVFARSQVGSLYVGKLAVWPHRQGQGIGRRLMQAAEDCARQTGHAVLELETRIELTENHDTFAALGFVKTGEHAHDGYDRPTFITMRKRLAMTLAGKTFRAVVNSSNGAINTDTTMSFLSEDERGVLGVYGGGTIRTGQVVARRRDEWTVEMLYQCVTGSDELKAGRALARFSQATDEPLRMHLDWQWLTGDQSKGTSEWVLEPA